jgi:hypothetical protein
MRSTSCGESAAAKDGERTAHRVAGEVVRPVDPSRAHTVVDPVRDGSQVEARPDRRRRAEAGHVDRDDTTRPGNDRHDTAPDDPRRRETVHEHERVA